MNKILVINSSVGGEASLSRRLTQEIVKRLQTKHPGSEVKEYDLSTSPLPHVDAIHSAAVYQAMSKPDQNTDAILARSNKAVQDLLAADQVVIGVPFYNFSIPSTLKAWIDYICRPGLTFRYSEKGVESLVLGKKVYIAISYGGVYSEGPMKSFDFAEPYLKAVLGFLGMKDITIYRAEGTSMPGMREQAFEKALASIDL